MPGLYSWVGGNANVAATNSMGLYGLSSNSSILSSAAVLMSLLSENGNVNFAFDSVYSNTKIKAFTANIGTTAGTYGNTSNIPTITVGSDGRVTSISNTSVSISTPSILP